MVFPMMFRYRNQERGPWTGRTTTAGRRSTDRPHDGRQRTRAAVLMMVLVVAGLVLACVEAGVLARYAIGVPVVSDPTLAEMLG